MAGTHTTIEVFCSYAHEDEPLLKQLRTHLSGLERQGLIATWHDRQILPGTNWAQAIDTHLERASLILLLVSPDFLASDYCYEIEMQRALQRHDAGEARVIPIVVRPCDWTSAPFAQLQCLPRDGKPITTWDNRDLAWNDVTAGIRREIEDLPLLSASVLRAALPAVWNVPYPRNPFFIGRDELLSLIRTQLQAGQTTALSQPQAISGLGGIGKTQLAVEYAYRYHQDYTAVLWARAESQEALVSSYNRIATLLALPEREAKEQEIIIQAVTSWLQTRRQWLLILDNADDLDLLPALLPPAPPGHILLTTRAWDMQRLAQRIEVETLPLEQGALFLLRRANLLTPDAALAQAAPPERVLALQLTEEMGGLPLALDQAGAYLEATGMSLEQYWQVYQQQRRALLKERRARVPDHPEPVATTWSLSFQRVEQRNPAAADLLRLCAFLAPDAIPEEILTQGASSLGPVLSPMAADAFLLSQAVEALRAFSLLRRDPHTRTLSVHRLVQAVLRDDMDAPTQRLWAERAIRALDEARPPVEHKHWPQWERIVGQAQACAELVKLHDLHLAQAASLLQQTGWYVAERGRYQEAQPLLEQALHISEQEQGAEHLDTARDAATLGWLYERQGKYVEAAPLLQRALAIREQQQGSEHPSTAISLNNLASLYERQGKYAEAEPLYQRSLTIRERKLGPEHPSTATGLNNLANLYRSQGKYVEAEPLYQRALAIREQQLGPEDPSTATSLNNLANLYERQGKYAEAEPLLQRALAIYEQQLGLEHHFTATSLHSLAYLYQRQGKYAEAEPLYRRALGVCERQLGPQHPDTRATRGNYASLLRTMGRAGEATALETHNKQSS